MSGEAGEGETGRRKAGQKKDTEENGSKLK